ncbi:type IX secretion system plug protein domain-containing protein [Ignavibacterium sp.]|uniref:type IX secretion system plug protein n=1 Tax=Ignavibacterium sp. TaxID=2651167 RepID=UPI0025C09062|nr:type IX secretion system plug protein domain-containing protein [Ignavibacterium sp.]
MKKLILILFFSLAANIFSQEILIRSLQVYTSDDEKSFPVLTSKNQLVIEFDVKSATLPVFNIVFRFCDRNWKPVDNIFFNNYGQNTAYFLDHFSLPVTVEEADYHFINRFPDKTGYVSFPFSGKWRFYVVDPQDTTKVYAQGKFIVANPEVALNIDIKKETIEDKAYYPPELARSYWVIVKTTIPEDFFNHFVDEAEIFRNHLVDYPIRINRNGQFDFNRKFEWDGSNNLTFIAKDFRPGNGYRQVNLMNTNIYSTKNVLARFEGFESDRFYKNPLADFNGGMVLYNHKDPFATYMNVRFSIKPSITIYGDVYLVGAFNEWKVLPEYKMEFDGELYTKTVLLKRGIYDYQYVVVNGSPDNPENIDWYILEGNNWEARNTINVLLYYRDQNYGGYDRLIGFSRIKTK